MRMLLPSLSLLCLHVCACKPVIPKKTDPHRQNTAVLPAADTMVPASDTIVANEITSWSRFEDYTGRYAGEVDLLQKEPLKQRFRNLLGRDTVLFIQRFQVAPPIEIEGNLLYNEGCQPHNCGTDEAALAIDMSRDLIYAGMAIKGRIKVYAEKNDTAYPQRLREWKQRVLQNRRY
jgi:hypothetical protein